MKKLLAILFLFSALSIQAVDLITATITVTNKLGVTNLSTLVVNGNTRTWVTSVSNPSTEILTNNTDLKSATNLYNAIAAAPFVGLTLTRVSTNGIALRTAPGGALTVTIGGTWGVYTLSTNALTQATVVRVPYTVDAAATRTNIENGIVGILNGTDGTAAIYENSRSVQNLVGITNVQRITGAKTFSSASGTVVNLTNGTWWGGVVTQAVAISGNVASLTNGGWLNGTLTNGINRGSAFSSPGNGVSGQQFGDGASATANGALAAGNSSSAIELNATAVGYASSATYQYSSAFGANATAQGTNSAAVGSGANVSADNGTAIGVNSAVLATHYNSTAIGSAAVTTASNQVMLGTASIDVAVNHNLTVGGAISGVSFGNTNKFPSGSDVAFGRYALTTLAAGNNAGIIVGTNVFVEVSGPGSAFTINGIAGGRDGKFLIILNQTTFNMTIAHDSGTDPVAANRIYTMTGADRTTTGNGAAILIYSGAASRWILISLDP